MLIVLCEIEDRPAPQPIVVVEVGVAGETLGAAAVARPTIGLERRSSASHREAQQIG